MLRIFLLWSGIQEKPFLTELNLVGSAGICLPTSDLLVQFCLCIDSGSTCCIRQRSVTQFSLKRCSWRTDFKTREKRAFLTSTCLSFRPSWWVSWLISRDLSNSDAIVDRLSPRLFQFRRTTGPGSLSTKSHLCILISIKLFVWQMKLCVILAGVKLAECKILDTGTMPSSLAYNLLCNR